ncbi:MAG: prepilin peptidase [Phycisphaerales bacterium]|nr:prepilin peptidase [Phycisphaerales bacterium]
MNAHAIAFSLPASWLAVPPMVFVAMVGACVGSFINVLVYRLPRGEGIWSPPSRCPSCGTRLTWRENFPVLGWVFLGGRCRFCRSKISPEYPLIEAATAAAFLGLFLVWFPGVGALSPPTGAAAQAPNWARAGLGATWPMLLIAFTLVGSLLAMTLIDARTFTIPLVLPWAATAVAMAAHPLHALALGAARGDLHRPLSLASHWTIPTPTGAALGAAIGGGAGLALSLVLLRIGWIPRSFADFDRWAEEAKAASAGAPAAPVEEEVFSLRALLLRTLLFTGPAVGLMVVGFLIGERFGRPMPGMLMGALAGLVVGALLRAAVPVSNPTMAASPAAETRRARPAALGLLADVLPPLFLGGAGWLIGPGQGLFGVGVGMTLSVAGRRWTAPEEVESTDDGPPHWLAYPHARREMIKELAFLLPPTLLAVLGVWVFRLHPIDPPLWVEALGGSVLGYLAGGAVVWAIRLLASLAFGSEAMGLGDVHLMAAVGAALGWADPLLAFAVAPLLGLGWTMMVYVFRGGASAALPYGPHLAVATLAVMIAHPQFERLLAGISGGVIRLP